MKLAQAVLQNSKGDEKVYWLKSDPYCDRVPRKGGLVILAEEGIETAWEIKLICCEVPDGTEHWLEQNLKARIGTILSLY